MAVMFVAGCSGDADEGARVADATPDATFAASAYWDKLRDQALAEEAAAAGVDVPTDVEFVEYIHPDDFGRIRSQCMRDQGFEASETFDGGVSYGRIPQDQAEAQAVASMRCSVMYPVHPRYLQPPTEEELRVIYRYYVDELVPCLTDRGFDVGEVPTWETFRDTYESEDSWMPYNADVVHNVTAQAEWQEINEACPQVPPGYRSDS